VMWSKFLFLASIATRGISTDDLLQQPGVLEADDECTGDKEACSLNALQLQGEATDDDAEATPWVTNVLNETTNETVPLPGLKSSWSWGGDKVWGSGRGIESVSPGYLNSGFAAARGGCGGSGCALIINPPGHRSVNVIHIHSVHYGGYGASLKKRLESKVCGKGGWHGGGLPCGGKAAFFSGFPGVGSKAASAGSISHDTIIAWPGSCGGSGTIVEIGYGCSIEHQIRGDFNPRLR